MCLPMPPSWPEAHNLKFEKKITNEVQYFLGHIFFFPHKLFYSIYFLLSEVLWIA